MVIVLLCSPRQHIIILDIAINSSSTFSLSKALTGQLFGYAKGECLSHYLTQYYHNLSSLLILWDKKVQHY